MAIAWLLRAQTVAPITAADRTLRVRVRAVIVIVLALSVDFSRSGQKLTYVSIVIISIVINYTKVQEWFHGSLMGS
ncbi:hypothetical protein [Billgrantia desiderata]|uniref:hypothetical protein n=1 Tax=Billgrantia desiderata TaxID=52021 RepID=UPI0017486F96